MSVYWFIYLENFGRYTPTYVNINQNETEFAPKFKGKF